MYFVCPRCDTVVEVHTDKDADAICFCHHHYDAPEQMMRMTPAEIDRWGGRKPKKGG